MFQASYAQYGKRLYPNIDYYKDEQYNFTPKPHSLTKKDMIKSNARARVTKIYDDEYDNVRE